jgi:hypothetical protein
MARVEALEERLQRLEALEARDDYDRYGAAYEALAERQAALETSTWTERLLLAERLEALETVTAAECKGIGERVTKIVTRLEALEARMQNLEDYHTLEMEQSRSRC